MIGHHVELVRRDDLANGAFDLSSMSFGLLQTGAGRDPHVQANHARIDGRKEILADTGISNSERHQIITAMQISTSAR